MGAWFIFMIKSVFCLTTLFLFYKVLLSKETFHTLNRYALLGILTIATLLPFFKIPTTEIRPIQLAFQTLEFAISSQGNEAIDGYMLPEVTVNAEREKGFNLQLFIAICLAIYLTGAAARTIFLGRSLYNLKKTIRKARKVQYGKYTIAIVPGKVSPYSWWHYIVLSEEDYEGTNGEILAHELAHLSRHHSTDIMLCELFVIFQWFNPAIYLLKQELQSIHEYEADMAVIQNGFNPTQYQLLLIKKAVGSSSYTLANSLNHSSLKKRITMMLRKRSNRWASLKAFGFLPLAALMLSAFARPEVSAKTEALTGIKSTENVSDKNAIFQKEITNQTIAVQGDSKDSSKFAIRVRSGSVSDKELADCMVVIDGKVAPDSKKALAGINQDEIASIDILKDKAATSIYGEKGKKGVVLITTKKGAMKEIAQVDNKKESEKPAGVQIVATSGDPGAAYTIRVRDNDILSNAKDPLIVIDDVPYEFNLDGTNLKELSTSSYLRNINPADILNVTILKDSASTAIYGEKGKEGAVVITTKKGKGGSANGKETKGLTSSDNQEPVAYAMLENPPQFPDGENAMMEWIMKNVQYPEGAKARGEAGRVTVSFIINKDGKVVNGKVERGVSTELDQEALRVVSIMPNWTPGKQKGVPVDVKYVLPVSFKLSGGEVVKPNAAPSK